MPFGRCAGRELSRLELEHRIPQFLHEPKQSLAIRPPRRRPFDQKLRPILAQRALCAGQHLGLVKFNIALDELARP